MSTQNYLHKMEFPKDVFELAPRVLVRFENDTPRGLPHLPGRTL